MKISVKILNGQEASFQVSETEPVLAVKRLIAQEMNVPLDHQRLVYKGKTLADNFCLHDYKVESESKLHLFVKKPTTSSSHPQTSSTDFWDHMRRLLKSHLNEKDVDKVISRCREDFNNWSSQLSLDDIERMSELHMEETSMDEAVST